MAEHSFTPDMQPEDQRHQEIDERLIEDFASQPHDAFFKHLFSDLTNAAAFFQSHLNQALVTSINWDSLRLEPSSFVKRDLKQSHSDLLFTATIGAQQTYIYFLFEHQTTEDKSMPLRLLGYMTEIWMKHRQTHPHAPLPPVIPLVLHQGPSAWTVSLNFSDLFELPIPHSQSLLAFVPQFTHVLLDLTEFDVDLKENADSLRMALRLMQLARQRQDLLGYFVWLNEMYPNVTENLFRLFLLYALHVEASLDVEALMKQNFMNQRLESIKMTAAAILEAKGEARGEQNGILKGKIRMLEQFLQSPAMHQTAMDELSTAGLQAEYERLQAEYDFRFKPAK